MSNFKSGSGDLDFGGEGEEDADETDGDAAVDERGRTDSAPEGQGTDTPTDRSAPDVAPTGQRRSVRRTPETGGSSPSTDEYPYFVRRSNVGDERDTRLEIHVRDEVADREAAFRRELAERLGASEVSKTDAREFALLAAFRCPDRVAELMREEGFGALE